MLPTSRLATLAVLSCLAAPLAAQGLPETAVRAVRLPEGGLQPRVEKVDGVLHVVYFAGELRAGDLFYIASSDDGASFTEPVRVNSEEGTVDARAGTRGASMSIGDGRRMHVGWVGAPGKDVDRPLYYTRSSPLGEGELAFEAQRDLSGEFRGIDARPAVVQGKGRVFVLWHAPGATTAKASQGEPGRRVYARISADEGTTFDDARAVDLEHTGASAGCALSGGMTKTGKLVVFYRLRSGRTRDLHSLVSADRGVTFESLSADTEFRRERLRVSSDVGVGPGGMIAAWERENRVWWAEVNGKNGKAEAAAAARQRSEWQGRPSIIDNGRKAVVVAFCEGDEEGEAKRVSWQGFDINKRSNIGLGRLGECSPDTTPAIFVRADGLFGVVF